jgi:hypothetical protein
LLLIGLLGGHGTLIVRPWRATLLPLTLPSLHVTGAASLAVPARLAFDLGGPGLVGVALLVLTRWVRPPWVAAALVANAAILFFYALIEAADVLLDLAGSEAGVLGWEEFNYGVPLLLLAVAAIAAARIRSAPHGLAG